MVDEAAYSQRVGPQEVGIRSIFQESGNDALARGAGNTGTMLNCSPGLPTGTPLYPWPMFVGLVLFGGLLGLWGCTDSGQSSNYGDASDPALDGQIAVTDGPVGSPMQDAGTTADSDVETPHDVSVATIPVNPERTAFALPIHSEDRHHIQSSLVIGVDHDPSSEGALVCRSYDGRNFPACYDGHDGTDFMVWGGFDTIDIDDVRVIAAAPGTVLRVEDGHYDRCHGELSTGDVSCDGNPIISNRVHIRHLDGLVSRYLHLKRGSIEVSVGDVVLCGQVIGLVGSSGRSVAPHLHFEVTRAGGQVVDPFAGEFTRPQSYWTEQEAEDGLPGRICTR